MIKFDKLAKVVWRQRLYIVPVCLTVSAAKLEIANFMINFE